MILFGYSKNTLMPLTDRHWLPLSLNEIKILFLFKKRLKAYYFNLAFENVTTV